RQTPAPLPWPEDLPMSILAKFDPPAFMDDLDHIKGGSEAWDAFMDKVFDWAISQQKDQVVPSSQDNPATVQFFNPRKTSFDSPLIEQPVTWSAFPKELLVRFGRDRALIEADRLWPMEAYHQADYDPSRPGQPALDAKSTAWYRPHNEYCE